MHAHVILDCTLRYGGQVLNPVTGQRFHAIILLYHNTRREL